MKARALAVLVALLAAAACNSGAGACPSSTEVQPGGTCSDEHLQCAYTLSTPSSACDGTTTTIASSCTCTHGSWACPDPFECEGGAPDAGGDEAGDDGGGGNEAGEAGP